MGSKTISLREETYDRLERVKGKEESFSDAIERLLETDEQPLEGLVGILTDEQAARLRDHSRSFRDEVEERAGGE